MTINFTTVAGLRVQTQLDKASGVVERTFERLASGQRINRASDDAAGLSISSQLTTNVRVYTQSLRNINDGISVLNIADGASDQLAQVLTRLKELATQAANGTFSSTQRGALNTEGQVLRLEFNRIVNSTAFNGLNLLQRQLGTLRIQLGDTTGSGGISITPSDLGTSKQNNGTFATTQNLTGINNTSSGMADGDFNGDGYKDFVTVSSGGSSGEIFLNNGDGTFRSGGSVAPTSSGSLMRAVASGDFNGDGKADIAYAQSAIGGSGVRIQLGNGDGTFQSATDVSGTQGASTIRALAVGDINNDGKDDIVASEATGGGIDLLTSLGNGSFSFSTLSSGFIGTRSVAVGDFNGDGRLDVAAGGISGAVRMLLQDSSGSFSTTVAGTYGSSTVLALRAGDFDGDGIAELAVGGGSTLYIGKLQGGNSLIQVSSTSGGTTINDLRVGDVNGDGVLDVVAARSNAGSVANTGIFLNQGTGASFTFSSSGSTSYAGAALILADLDLDGTLDIATSSTTSSALTVQAGNGDRTALLDSFSLTSQNGARTAMIILERALTNVLDGRGRIGAQQSRLDTALKVVRATRDESDTARAQITDADVAGEQAQLFAARIRQQVASSLLGQANQEPLIALSLLR